MATLYQQQFTPLLEFGVPGPSDSELFLLFLLFLLLTLLAKTTTTKNNRLYQPALIKQLWTVSSKLQWNVRIEGPCHFVHMVDTDAKLASNQFAIYTFSVRWATRTGRFTLHPAAVITGRQERGDVRVGEHRSMFGGSAQRTAWSSWPPGGNHGTLGMGGRRFHSTYSSLSSVREITMQRGFGRWGIPIDGQNCTRDRNNKKLARQNGEIGQTKWGNWPDKMGGLSCVRLLAILNPVL